MAKASLTLANVRQLPYVAPGAGSRWCVYWDAKLHGLGLRVTESGVRSYIIRYRVRGGRLQRIKTIGAISTFTLQQARERAKDVIRSAELGKDWFDSVERSREKTVQELWDYYKTHHLKPSDVSVRISNEAPWVWDTHCAPRFGKRPIASVTPEQTRDWHRQVTKRGPYAANRAAQLMRAVWNYGTKFGQVPREVRNPFTAISLNRELPRKVILRPDELPVFAKAVEAVENPFARAFFWMLFYTGARRSEMLSVRWQEVDLTGKLINFPCTKNGESHQVHLSPPAIALLQNLPRSSNPFVFAGDRDDRPLHPKKPWERIRVDAGLPHLRMHDLRRSFGSWLGAIGYSSKQVGTTLGHKSDITSRVYIQLGEAFDLKRDLAVAFAKLARHYRVGRSQRTKTRNRANTARNRAGVRDRASLPAPRSDPPRNPHIDENIRSVTR
jgi:integrase